MVVVPTMLTSSGAVARLIETLEIHYLANRDKHLYFALLSDFQDAPEESQPEDKPLLRLAQAGVEVLNAKYNPTGPASSFCSTGPVVGTKPKACGWVMSASGAN